MNLLFFQRHQIVVDHGKSKSGSESRYSDKGKKIQVVIHLLDTKDGW